MNYFRSKSQSIILLLMIVGLFSCQPNKNLVIPSLFSDNMVLQQQTDVAVWGKSTPNKKIEVEGSWGVNSECKVDQRGNWITYLHTPDAGGPYTLKITTGDTTCTYTNVMMGEVWLCSGQSNMEMPLMGWPPDLTIQNSEKEIESASYPNLRFFTVTRNYSAVPIDTCRGTWEVCSPATAKDFSATAFFFGKKLYQELGVPIGLIHSSWGGTPVESWIRSKYLENRDDFSQIYKDMNEADKKLKELEELLGSKRVKTIDTENDSCWVNLDLNDIFCANSDFDDSKWKTMELPVGWESTEVGNFDGVIWFRKTVDIPKSWNGDLILELGPIDDMDDSYFNGQKIGATDHEGFWNANRKYTIPAQFVHPGKNLIAVRVIDNQGGGGIYGKPELLKIYPVELPQKAISLAGSWKYLPVAEYRNSKLYLFDPLKDDFNARPVLPVQIGAGAPSCLFNAMIAPIIPYSLKGFIWYQGESNTGNPSQYTEIFPLLIQDWREEWNQPEAPFYFVQIAPFDYGSITQSEKLREAQFKTLSVPYTGMAVTLDIGNPKNVHPADKTDVGDRLAFWALAKNYGKNIPFSGPQYKSVEVNGNKLILSFDYAESGLVLKEGTADNFLIAGSDSIFMPATVQIVGQTLEVSNPKVKNPVAVRYAWTNTAQGSLFNNDGLPASSFRTDNWKN